MVQKDKPNRYKDYEKGYIKYRQEHRQEIREMVKRCDDIRRFGGNKQLALERDNFQCLNCGMSQEQHFILFNRGLTVDHIDGKGRNSEVKNNSLDNLQTLCLRCHGHKDAKLYYSKKRVK